MKKKKILKFLIWSFAGIVTLMALLYAWIDWAGARAWKKTEAELLAKGEPMRLGQVIPPPIPDAQNFAFSPFFEGVFETEAVMRNGRQFYRPKYPEAGKRLNSLALPQDLKSPIVPSAKNDQPTDLTAWQSYFRAHPEFQMPETVGTPAEDVVLALANWKAPLDEIARDLRARPLMRAPLRYDAGFEMTIPHIGGMLQVSKFYQLRAIAQIRQGHFSEAMSDLESMLLLRKAMEPRGTLIGCLVATSIGAMTIPVIREGLAAHAWNDAQLMNLSARLEQINPLAELSSALRFERVVFLDATRRMTSNDLEMMVRMGGDPSEKPPAPWGTQAVLWGIFHLPRGLWEMDRELYSRLMQEHLEKVLDDKQGRFHVAASQDFEAQLLKRSAFPEKMLHILTVTAIPVLSRLGSKSAEMNASMSEARVAIALERYRVAHGALPDNLTALVPEFLVQVPIDPIDGQSLRYDKVSDTSYRIWSIGWDEKDETGVASKKSTEGDWVWTSLSPVVSSP